MRKEVNPQMEMDEMELDRYITGMLDTEHHNLKRNVTADKHKQKGDDKNNEPGQQRLVETNS